MSDDYDTEAWYWLSSEAMTFGFKLNREGIVVETPAIAHTFVGQHVDNLKRWMRKQGGLRGGIIR